MKKLIKQIIPICLFFFYVSVFYAQVLTEFPCFAVAKNNGTINNLHAYNPDTNYWALVGNTSTNNIAAIAVDSEAAILYAVDSAPTGSAESAAFGSIDLQTGVFTAIGNLGMANGENGAVLLNQIEGLTYDDINKIMYAVHRVDGTGAGTNDLLFQIDVATGLAVSGAMQDAEDKPVDYAVIDELFDNTIQGEVYDVSDIAISPELSEDYYGYYGASQPGDLFAIHAENGPGALSVINKTNGKLVEALYDFPNDDVESIGFNSIGQLYATTGDDGSTQRHSNTLILIDFIETFTLILSNIDNSPPIDVDFESFDCLHAVIALQPKCVDKIELSGIINSGEYMAEIITTNEETENFTASGADIKCVVSNSVTFHNLLVSKECDFSVDIDIDLCN